MGWNNWQVLMEFPLLRVLDFRIGSLVSNSARNITGPFSSLQKDPFYQQPHPLPGL